MEKTDKKDKKVFCCGKCKKQYSKKQTWEQHFNLETVRSGQGYVDNVCYKTTGPRVWDNDLEIAIQKYKDAVKQMQAASSFFQRTHQIDQSPTPSSSATSTPEPACKKQKVEEISTVTENVFTSDTDMKNTLDRLLRCQKETLEIVTQNRELLKRNASSASTSASSNAAPTKNTSSTSTACVIQENNFDINMAPFDKARSTDEILENELIKSHFKLIENKHIETLSENPTPTETFPKDVIKNIAATDITMPNINIDCNDSDDNIDDNLEEATFLFYCIACTEKNDVCCLDKNVTKKGFYTVKDPKYCCKKGDKLERWFSNLKMLLKAHLSRLQHHQKAAIYDVIKSNNEKKYKRIEDTCSNILYYIMKTNTAWALYPVLLAVLYSSGHEVGNINHSRYSCEQMCYLLNKELVLESRKWFNEQKSVTVTADVGTILGLSMLVVLLESDHDKSVKLAGLSLISSKSGEYLANEIFEILKSPNHLNLPEEDIKLKVSGMAGDGAFCKENQPFKSKMKLLFGENFKFRWDILHLVNRAHLDALENTSELTELLDFIQCHSSKLRTGLAYTSMVISNLIGFKRPKLKSETRMVNFEFDQLDRFIDNAKFFDHPEGKVLSAHCYILISLSTKIILQVAQKTTVSSDFINDIFYNEGGKRVMLKVLDILSAAGDDNVTDYFKEIKLADGSHEDYICGEVCEYVKRNASIFEVSEATRPTRTRSEGNVDKQSVLAWVRKYVDFLWEGISKRLKYCDKDGTTNWSEAPAEGVFSILGYIIENKPSLTVENMMMLCRIVKEGPAPGTKTAAGITKRAIEKWPTSSSRDKAKGRFISNKYMTKVTSTTVLKCLEKDKSQ